MKQSLVVLNQVVVAGCLVGLLTVQVACGSGGKSRLPGGGGKSQPSVTVGEAQLPGSTGEAPLTGAVYAKVVPVYPGAQYVGSVGRPSGKGARGRASSESQTWFFKTSDPAEDVLAFYQKKLPTAAMAKDDAGDSTFTLIPPGAETGERVQVIFRKGGFLQIHESVRPGKKQG
jgi:hypothetical protein